jgi:hypothetical protein
MSNILISLGKPATPELLDAILVALASGWGEAKVDIAGSTTVISFGNDPVAAELPPEPEITATSDDCMMSMPDLSADQAATLAAVAPIELSFGGDGTLAPAEVPADAVPVAAPIGLPNAIIKSLSLSAQVKTVYDCNGTIAQLRVPNVQDLYNGLIQFTYGGVEYKYPAIDMGIVQVAVAFTGKENDHFQLSVQIIPLQDGQLEELIIGSSDQDKIQAYL